MVGRVVGFVLTALTMAAGVSLTLWAVMELAVPYQQNRLEFVCLLLAGVAATTVPIIKWAGGVAVRNDEEALQRCVRWGRISRELAKLGLSQRG
ncbi:hypothetical protein IJI99_03620 [bacterium]|nr:hypothetical protein [bacterium]